MAGGGLEVWPEPIVEAISDIMEYERGGEPCPRTSPMASGSLALGRAQRFDPRPARAGARREDINARRVARWR